MFGTVTVAVALFCATVVVVPSAAPPTASRGFAGGARVATIGGLAWPSGREYTAVAGDGDVYVAGPGGSDGSRPVEVRRYLPGGRIDPSFGGDGTVVLGELDRTDPRLTDFRLGGLLVDTNGLPYLFGTSGPDRPTGPDQPTVVRLTAEGALDPTYGEGGDARFDFGPGTPSPRAAIDQGNRVVLAAGRVARLTPSGTLDTTFGDGGTVPIPGDAVGGLGVDEKGRVQLALPDATADGRAFRLMRLDGRGRPDPSLGPTGLHTYKGIGAARAMAVGSDGRTIVLGTAAKHDPAGGVEVPLLEIGSREIHGRFQSGHRLEVHLHGHSYASALLSDPNGDDYLVGTQVTRRPGATSWRNPRHQGLAIDLDGPSGFDSSRFGHIGGLFDRFGPHQRVVIASPAELIATGAAITDGGGKILVDGIARRRSATQAAHGFLAEIPTAERVITYAPEPAGG
jgi:uncharacterized delta-60 repeat protein